MLPESAHPIEHATLAGGRIVIHYLVDVQSELRLQKF